MQVTQPLLYGDLVLWYRLIDPVDDHAEEAAAIQVAIERAVEPRPETLLELGAGAGHNAFHLKRRFRCTLNDLSEAMLGLSRDLNPDCEHELGDMRTLRLGRQFDAVLIHDAIMYLTNEGDVRAAAETAFAHTRPGGAAVFAPDAVRETFQEGSETFSAQDGVRSMRGLDWSMDPDPTDDTFVTEYVFLLREGDVVSLVHDRHIEGLFSIETWRRILMGVGCDVATFKRPVDDHGETDEIFICRRPER